MSVKVMAEVFQHSQATLGARLVLLAIADCVDEQTRTGWPSVPLVARKARLDERNVQRAIQRLVKLHELVVEHRPFQASLYTVAHLPGGGASATPGITPPPGAAPPPPRRSATTLVAPAPPRTVKEPSREPSETMGFTRFYDAYPKKRHRPDALKAWRQVHGDDQVEAILAGIKSWNDSQQWHDQRIEDPATFLRQEQWKDAPLLKRPQSSGRTHVPDAAATRRMLREKGL
jgi:hypothetical protein